VQEIQRPFVPLTHDEFAKLSTDEKVWYLARAMESLSEERGGVFAKQPARSTRTLQ
jgi:uncharacterized ferredoxin-like protein